TIWRSTRDRTSMRSAKTRRSSCGTICGCTRSSRRAWPLTSERARVVRATQDGFPGRVTNVRRRLASRNYSASGKISADPRDWAGWQWLYLLSLEDLCNALPVLTVMGSEVQLANWLSDCRHLAASCCIRLFVIRRQRNGINLYPPGKAANG